MDISNADYLWLRREDSNWLEKHLPDVKVTERKKMLQDWEQIDAELSEEVEFICQEIMTTTPIVRVSITEIIKRSEKKTWLEKRDKKLPQTSAVIDQYCESLESFMLRKIEETEKLFLREGSSVTKNQFAVRGALRNSTSRNSPLIQYKINAAVERINSRLSE